MGKINKATKLGKYTEEKLAFKFSAFEAFKRLYPFAGKAFLLESLGEEGNFNRYSYLGFRPIFTVSAKNGILSVNGKREKVQNAYTELMGMMAGKSSGKNYCGGLVGYVSYEGTKYFEPAFKGYPGQAFPDFEFGYYEDGLKFDKRGESCVYFHHGKSRKKEIAGLLNKSGKLGRFTSAVSLNVKTVKEHGKMVENAKKHLQSGNIFQVVLSLKKKFKITGDNRRIYAVLRTINPAPYMMYLKFGGREILSASPELLLRVKGKNIEHFGTLAGTIKRGSSEKEDMELAKILKADPKEMAEHMMLVDLARNDVGRVSRFGSVKVEKLASVKKYSFVQHLYTEVRGVLKKGENSFTALSSCFPAGTLTGAPKIEAMKIIKSLEGEARGPYGGVGGYFSLNGESMHAILIRSLFISGKTAYTQTGSGIVQDSFAGNEYQEIINKQKGLEETLLRATED